MTTGRRALAAVQAGTPGTGYECVVHTSCEFYKEREQLSRQLGEKVKKLEDTQGKLDLIERELEEAKTDPERENVLKNVLKSKEILALQDVLRELRAQLDVTKEEGSRERARAEEAHRQMLELKHGWEYNRDTQEAYQKFKAAERELENANRELAIKQKEWNSVIEYLGRDRADWEEIKKRYNEMAEVLESLNRRIAVAKKELGLWERKVTQVRRAEKGRNGGVRGVIERVLFWRKPLPPAPDESRTREL